jgi:hypothetical protein
MRKIETVTEILELPCKLIIPLQHEFLMEYAVGYGLENNSLTGRLFVKFRIPRNIPIINKLNEDFINQYSQVTIEDEPIEISDGHLWKRYELKSFFYLTIFEK